MVLSLAPTARAMRAELWPITCRARSRRRVPPASIRACRRVAGVTASTAAAVPLVGWPPPVVPIVGSSRRVSMSGHRLGFVIGRKGMGMAGLAGGVQGPADLLLAQSGLPGRGGQRAQVGRVVGFQGAVGGPEQARVAV